MPDESLEVLYMPDFIVLDKRALNTLCLYYDRLYLHDYFGVFSAIYDKEGSQWLEEDYALDLVWLTASGFDKKTREFCHSAISDPLEALSLKGIMQSMRLPSSRYSPRFLINYAKTYASFLRNAMSLIHGDILRMCHTSKNPYSPINIGFGVAQLDEDCSLSESENNFQLARENNIKACMFEQEYHKLPLISDQPSDKLKWGRDAELLTMAIALSAIPARVPEISSVNPEVLIEVREHLRMELKEFRTAVLNGAWEIGQASREDSLDEVTNLAKLYYKTKLEPSIKELSTKLAEEDAKLRKKFLERSLDQAIILAKAIDPMEPNSKWDLLSSALKSALDADSNRQAKAKITSPYEFLVKLPHELESRTQNC